jgi:peptide chain release factor subunit 3
MVDKHKNQARFGEIRDKLTPYRKKCGFKSGENTMSVPCSGMSGAFLKEHPGDQVVSRYK